MIRRTMTCLCLALAIAALSGCLTAERFELRVWRDPETSVLRYVTTWYNIASDGNAEGDYQELLMMWKGDEYLVDQARNGNYVQRRSVQVEEGVLVGREEGLAGDLAGFFEHFDPGPPLVAWWTGGDSLLTTNGQATQSGDTTFVTWPMGTRDFMVRFKSADFKPSRELLDYFVEQSGAR